MIYEHPNPMLYAGTPVIGLQCVQQEFITLPSGSFGCGIEFTPPPYAFNVYCENCTITFDVQWANHVGVDLDLRVTRDSNQSTAYVSGMMHSFIGCSAIHIYVNVEACCMLV